MKRWTALLVLLLLAVTSPAAAQQAQEEEAPRRVVYLTFDDGPKRDTPELLALLDELDVPATFFLVGLSVKAFPEHAKMIVEAGHAVGCHSMNHSAVRLKEGDDIVRREIERFQETMRECVGADFSTDLFRFPGGSTSYKPRTRRFVRNLGYAWFDWNVMTGDAQYSFDSNREMLEYTLDQVRGQDVIILLMHESKTRTRRILPELVAFFREEGYEFRTLQTGEEDREILARCKVNMMMPETASQE